MMESVGVRKNEIAKWVGISSAIVAGCQCIMAVPWGTLSDHIGRKYSILVREKELQPLAFSMMPLVWSIGSIFGPAFGGALANPAVKHPEIFGNWEIFKKYPFALPNILSAILFVVGILTGFLFLEVGSSKSLLSVVAMVDIL